MNKIPEIKIIRLNTGEDIIASCIFDDENNNVLVDNPMKIGVSRTLKAKTAIMMLLPWLPIELIEEDSTYINQNDIIAVLNPRASMIEYYNNLLDEFEKMSIEEESKIFANENTDGVGEDDDAEDEESFNLQEYIFSMKDDKKTTYH